jgi:ABC-2 type transport system permease protein
VTAAVAPRRRFSALRDIGTGIVAVGTKELRGRMRGRRAFLLLTFYLVVLAVFAWMLQLIEEQQVGTAFNGAFYASAQIGKEVFIGLIMFQTLLVLFLAPAYTSGAISLEREKQTLDMLATTPISSLAIVLGKLASALTFVFLLILASIPLTALVFTFGGVSPDDLIRGYLILFVTGFGLGTVGLFASSLVRRTQAATVLTYFLVLTLTLGTGFVFFFWGEMTNWRTSGPIRANESVIESLQRRPPGALLWFNPFAAQADVICGTETGFGVYCGYVGMMTDRPPTGFADVRPIPVDPNTGGQVAPAVQFGVQRDSFWPKSMAAWLILSVILIVLSVQMVTPTRRWRLRLPRPRRRPTGSET